MSEHPLARLIMLKGAIASVALSHEVGCSCDACKASHGDDEAFERLLFTLGDESLGR